MVPRLHTTPMITTPNESNIEVIERKNNKRIIAERIIDTIRNQLISFAIRVAICVLINGNPLI